MFLGRIQHSCFHALHSLAGFPCRLWPPSLCPHTAHWGQHSDRPDVPRALRFPRDGHRGRRGEASGEGRERAGRSVVRQLLLQDEGWSYEGWTAPEEKSSQEDPPHLKATSYKKLMRLTLQPGKLLKAKTTNSFHIFRLVSCEECRQC